MPTSSQVVLRVHFDVHPRLGLHANADGLVSEPQRRNSARLCRGRVRAAAQLVRRMFALELPRRPVFPLGAVAVP